MRSLQKHLGFLSHRNITGTKQRVYFDSGESGTIGSTGTGVFESTTGNNYMRMGEGAYFMTIRTLTFDASRAVPTGTENKPYAVSSMILINY